jgi:hypothetical protein
MLLSNAGSSSTGGSNSGSSGMSITIHAHALLRSCLYLLLHAIHLPSLTGCCLCALLTVQRKKTLLVEYKQLRKANTFIDRRFGGEAV